MLLFMLIGVAIVALAHTAPAPFALDALAGDLAVWHMPRSDPPTIYLTYDDGPNPATTPDLLDVLKREEATATFFLIDRHLTEESAPIVRRMFAEGHAVALHSASRRYMLYTPPKLARTLTAAADRIESLAGTRPCRAFRPHAGWRGGSMYEGLKSIDYKLVGWGWMLWDFNWFRARNADDIVPRLADHASRGDIVVIHDGHHKNPRADRRYAIDTVDRLIPDLRSKGFEFGVICPNQPRGSAS